MAIDDIGIRIEQIGIPCGPRPRKTENQKDFGNASLFSSPSDIFLVIFFASNGKNCKGTRSLNGASVFRLTYLKADFLEILWPAAHDAIRR